MYILGYFLSILLPLIISVAACSNEYLNVGYKRLKTNIQYPLANVGNVFENEMELF